MPRNARRPSGAGDPRPPSLDERLATLGTAVATVAHEINNPITYVLGNIGELERLTGAMRETILTYRELVRAGQRSVAAEIATVEAKLEQNGGLGLLDELLADTLEGARRIRDVVRDLVAATRGAELHKEVFDVVEVLDQTLRLAVPHFSRPVEIERDYRATRSVVADRGKLGQVFLNLIANAADACALARTEKPRIQIRTSNRAAGVEIELEDSGEGIPDAVRERLFLPFVTTKEPGAGTGLGLYISRRIVEEHGGSLAFRSPDSGGTIFSVYLPVEER